MQLMIFLLLILFALPALAQDYNAMIANLEKQRTAIIEDTDMQTMKRITEKQAALADIDIQLKEAKKLKIEADKQDAIAEAKAQAEAIQAAADLAAQTVYVQGVNWPEIVQP